MFDKWGINRYPFYTRPIDKENLHDFFGREDEYKIIKSLEKTGEGVVSIIGDRGIGTTSFANFSRFRFKNAFTVPFEIRMEQFESAFQTMEALVYSTALEIKNQGITSRIARQVLKQYDSSIKDISVSAGFAGFGGIGMKISSKEGGKALFSSLLENLHAMIKDITKSRKRQYKCCIYQLNNMDVPGTVKREKLESLLNPLRDVFHSRNTVWLLLGDEGFESFIKNHMTRISSIVRHWIHMKPLTEIEFESLYNLRIKNSGANAISPFTREAVKKISACTVGKTRFALDLAGRLMERYADAPFPQFIGNDLVQAHSREEITAILDVKQLGKKVLEALKAIRKHPGIGASKLANEIGVSPTNLVKYTKPLIGKGLVRSEKEGRAVKLFAEGFGNFL